MTLEGDDAVLAKVNGSPITRYDVRLAMRTGLSGLQLEKAGNVAEEKVLKSLVTSRAIAQKMEQELDVKERQILDKEMQAHREKVLVQRYLEKHAPPKRVTRQMVDEFYEQNSRQFGGEKKRVFEMLHSKRSLAVSERTRWINETKDAKDVKDWAVWQKSLEEKGLPVVYRKGYVSEKMLHPNLRKSLSALLLGETSSLLMIEGRAHLVRIMDEKRTSPEGLESARQKIEAALTQREIRASVQQASESVLNEVEVEYVKQGQ